MEAKNQEMMQLTASIIAAYVSNNPVPVGGLPDMIKSVHSTLGGLGEGSAGGDRDQRPAVPIKKSITPAYIVCLEDGKKLKMLKRYLRSNYELSPEQYRAKWNLPRDYPMVAPEYAAQRSEFAKKIGLGTTPGSKRPRKRS